MPDKNQRAKLVDIFWDETSGVDHPANEVEGWLVMKARQLSGLFRKGSEMPEINGDDFKSMDKDQLKVELEAEVTVVKQLDGLLQALQGAAEELGGAPEPVQEAANTLFSWLEQGGANAAAGGGGGAGAGVNPQQKRNRLLRALIGLLMGDDEEEVDETARFKSAITEAWPGFVDKVATIYHSEAETPAKIKLISSVVDELELAVAKEAA